MRNNGGPAFANIAQVGMSLRDYAAIKILSAMITSCPVVDRIAVDKKKWAQISFDWADEWLAERAK